MDVPKITRVPLPHLRPAKRQAVNDNIVVKVQLPCGKHAIRKVVRRHAALLEAINAHGILLALRDDSGRWWTAEENGERIKAASVLADVWERMPVFRPVQ